MIQVASHHVVVLREASDLANLVVDVARRPWEFAKETIAALDELRGNILELDLMAVTEAVLPDTTVLVKYWGPLAKHPQTKCQIAARSVIELAGTVFAVKGAANSLLKLKNLGRRHWTPAQAQAQFGAGPNPGATPPPVPPPAVGAPRKGPYSHLDDHPSVGPGKPFTQAQKRNMLNENRANNSGVIRSDQSGAQAVPGQQSTRGVIPPSNEAHVDHIVPRSKGGSNSYSNAQVLTREENLRKGAN